MPLIDENARTDAEDVESLHQVIDLNPSQILPAVDENAVDSMDFENQLGYLKPIPKFEQSSGQNEKKKAQSQCENYLQKNFRYGERGCSRNS